MIFLLRIIILTNITLILLTFASLNDFEGGSISEIAFAAPSNRIMAVGWSLHLNVD
jgi:hypothetical protein